MPKRKAKPASKSKKITRNKKGQFKKGVSGNPNGRPPKGYSITETMRYMLDSRPEVKEALGKVIMKKALDGDITAIKTLWQYMDGMPTQTMQMKVENIGQVLDNLETDYGKLAERARQQAIGQMVENEPPVQNQG